MLFSIFDSKLNLHELTELGFHDIHSHFLPGIDDGAPDVETSLSLLSQAKNYGFEGVVATPHIMDGVWNNTSETISNAYQTLINSNQVNLPLSYAAEHLIDFPFSNKIGTEELLCIKDNYILVEFSFSSMPYFAEQALFNLIISGYKPILAHPERYLYLYNRFETLEKFKKNGCLFQMNLLALTDYYGEGPQKLAQKMIDKGMYDFLGSDIHAQKHLDYYTKPIKKKNMPYLKQLLENNRQFLPKNKEVKDKLLFL